MKKNGFTLLELIIVTIIIAILAGIAVPIITRGTASAKAARAAHTIALYTEAIRLARLHGITNFAIRTAVANGEQILDTTILVGTNNDGMWTYTYTYTKTTSTITAKKIAAPQAAKTIIYNLNTRAWSGTYTPLPE